MARRICDYLGIEISDLLLPIGRQRHLDRALRIFLRLPPRLADTVIDQLMVMADALGAPIQLRASGSDDQGYPP